MCKKLIDAISTPDGYLLIVDAFRGGIGHKFQSILYDVIYAIVNHRRFYCFCFYY